MNVNPSESTEWLEADGLGGFASGTTLGLNTRRYHALLQCAVDPPAGRHVFINDLAVWIEGPRGNIALSSHRYVPDVLVQADVPVSSFVSEPWPRFERPLEGLSFRQEVIATHGLPLVLVRFSVSGPLPGHMLCVRPLMSGRNFHQLHRENGNFDFTVERTGALLRMQPYPGLPAVLIVADAGFDRAPDWYRQFSYDAERERGLDHVEDLASPGVLRFDLVKPVAECVLAIATPEVSRFVEGRSGGEVASVIVSREIERRSRFTAPLERAADAYLVKRGEGKTIIAGYPWFGDWGRDTFIALRGLCLATGRLREAADILLAWAPAVHDGLLPNRFADNPDDPPEYNSVDAALWYVIAVGDLLRLGGNILSPEQTRTLQQAVVDIIAGHRRGTLHGIGVSDDGLLRAGQPGVQLTWMDAKVGDWVVTPRIGKPVEVQALWLNALAIAAEFDDTLRGVLEHGNASFRACFDRGAGGLPDVVDADHEPGKTDWSLRPNQVLAVGGLPLALLPEERCRAVLDVVEENLLVSSGLRSLAAGSDGYVPHYVGGVWERDSAYHQGTVWPWLLGPFVEAWVRCRGSSLEAQREARRRFVEPWRRQLTQAGVGHVQEITDAEAPFTARGCPFQAWSVSELLRVERWILGGEAHEQAETMQPQLGTSGRADEAAE